MAVEFEKYRYRVTHGAAEYLSMISGLLPKGKIWGIDSVTFGYNWQETPSATAEEYYQEVSESDAVEFYQEADTASDAEGGSQLGLLLSCFASELARIDSDAVDLLDQTDPGLAVELLTDWEDELGTTGTTDEDRQRAAHAKKYSPGEVTDYSFWISLLTSYGFTGTVVESDFDENVCGVAVCGVAVCDDLASTSFVLTITIAGGDGSVSDLADAVTKYKQAHTWVWVVDAR